VVTVIVCDLMWHQMCLF